MLREPDTKPSLLQQNISRFGASSNHAVLLQQDDACRLSIVLSLWMCRVFGVARAQADKGAPENEKQRMQNGMGM